MYDDEYSGFRYWYWCRSHGTIRRAREFLARPETANHRNIGCSSYAKNRSAGSRFISKIENLLERGRLVAHISTVFRLHGNELQASFFFLLLSRSFSLFLFFRFIRQFAFLYSFEIGWQSKILSFSLSLSVSCPIETWSNFSSNMKIFDENVEMMKKKKKMIDLSDIFERRLRNIDYLNFWLLKWRAISALLWSWIGIEIFWILVFKNIKISIQCNIHYRDLLLILFPLNYLILMIYTYKCKQ